MLHSLLVLRELKACGVGCVAGLPDNASAGLIALLENDRDIRYVGVTREGEAFAVASGFWMGGGEAAVLVQNTGFLESGDSLRGTAQRMRAPLLVLVTYRGLGKMLKAGGPGRSGPVTPGAALAGPSVRHSGHGGPGNLAPELFSDSAMDSAALVTEPTLRA